ncbi:MAG TPA: ATP-dependent helicase C-terminal domain-containing protein, partial [Planctomycetaceae bacterium]|nr:ATP-dependent helicase C-terminal domain-containing protein [Planctomycetaceae bacterium]
PAPSVGSLPNAGEAIVRIASAVQREWLPEELLTVTTEVCFEETSQRVQARRQVRWEDLVLEESPAALPQDDSVARMLAEAAVRHWDRVRPADDSPAGRFVTRVRWLREWLPEFNLPMFDEAHLQSLLPALCVGRRSLAELKEAPWWKALQAELTSPQRQTVEREAPERLTVPSGNRMTLQYAVGRPPVLAVRIQEIFGWRETPRVARGRVRVLLHLLAPSHRPQQITDDLASFWLNAYPHIRSDLRRRYPKHAWPDDPLTAVPGRKS